MWKSLVGLGLVWLEVGLWLGFSLGWAQIQVCVWVGLDFGFGLGLVLGWDLGFGWAHVRTGLH